MKYKLEARKSRGVVFRTDVSHSQRAGDQIKHSGRESKFSFPLTFYSFGALKRWDEAHLHWRGKSALLHLPIQTLISSGNTLTDPPRNNV